jgi:hypothetical protein
VQEGRDAKAADGTTAVQFPPRQAMELGIERAEQRIGDDAFVLDAIFCRDVDHSGLPPKHLPFMKSKTVEERRQGVKVYKVRHHNR